MAWVDDFEHQSSRNEANVARVCFPSSLDFQLKPGTALFLCLPKDTVPDFKLACAKHVTQANLDLTIQVLKLVLCLLSSCHCPASTYCP